MKAIFRLLSLFIIVWMPAIAIAVTPQEMEQARTIAAKAYIRYVNDGSGYLDDLNPKTTEELQASLKPKEKENIKVFLEIPVPTDYQNWDLQQLADYWAGTAFKTKGLVEKGLGGRNRARTQINKMKLAPAQETPKTVETANAVQPKDTVQNAETVAENKDGQIDPLSQDQALAIDGENDFLSSDIEEANNYTWIYIMILAILVAFVIVLAVYGINIMKKNGATTKNTLRQKEIDAEEAMDKYQNMLSDKDYEISRLTKKLDEALRLNSDLKNKIDELSAELTALRFTPSFASTEKTEQSQKLMDSLSPKSTTLHTIYLGRANAKQIFVRADRMLNPGNSIFVLDTSDGIIGTFKVADSPSEWSLAISNPTEYLSYACTGQELENTSGATRILNEEAGTAVFEGGCWRVIKKAKIKYE